MVGVLDFKGDESSLHTTKEVWDASSLEVATMNLPPVTTDLSLEAFTYSSLEARLRLSSHGNKKEGGG